MKFWEKIFLSTLIIFEVFFIPASIYLISSNFNINLKTAIDSGISEHYNFCSSIKWNVSLLKEQGKLNDTGGKIAKKNIDSIINTYLTNFISEDVYIKNFSNEAIYLQILDENNKVVFTNLKFDLPLKRKELDKVSDKAYYIIRDIDKETYLFVTSGLLLGNSNYKVSYIKDVTDIYNNRKSMFMILFKLNIFISLILVISMILLSKYIVYPVNQLIKSTQKISSGHFSERVNMQSDDEFGELSRNFNKMARVVEEKITELERVSEDKQSFIDNLAHELRTPLTSIIGYADFLRTAKYDDETKISSLNFIYNQGKRLEKLSSDLMELIVLRKKVFAMKYENIREIFEQIKNSFIPKLESKNLELVILSDDFCFFMNINLIKILIANLVDNSVKASKSGDKIYLSAYKQENSNIVLEVKDMGVGIPEEDIPKVMQPFYMVDKSRERSKNGVGLGLSLCAQIAEIHNARISIESSVGKGSTIKITFLNI